LDPMVFGEFADFGNDVRAHVKCDLACGNLLPTCMSSTARVEHDLQKDIAVKDRVHEALRERRWARHSCFAVSRRSTSSSSLMPLASNSARRGASNSSSAGLAAARSSMRAAKVSKSTPAA